MNAGGFPKSVCTSVNECICHGIPDNRQLQDGDILNIDVTVYLNVSCNNAPKLNIVQVVVCVVYVHWARCLIWACIARPVRYSSCKGCKQEM